MMHCSFCGRAFFIIYVCVYLVCQSDVCSCDAMAIYAAAERCIARAAKRFAETAVLQASGFELVLK